jgi:hypothetical protein
MSMSIRVEDLKPQFGSIVHADKSALLDADTVARCRELLDPEINLQPEYVQGTFFWHMDGLNSDIPPPKATVLSGRRIAARGGQTEFASTYLEHPLIWNRRSGRKSPIIGCSAERVVGMPVPDGRALLARLVEWAAQSDFHYKHDWQQGDLVIWDNTGTLHRVRPYDRNSGRTMHRTSIAGDEAVN